jgi:hypothetical protein
MSIFPTRDKLKIHEKKCTNRLKCKCYICGKTYKQRYNLNKHMKKCKEKNTHSCILCEESFLSKEMLMEHVLVCAKSKTKVENPVVQNINNNNSTTTIDNSVNSVTNNNITINNTIALVSFGKENLSFITAEKLKKCFVDPKNAIKNLTQMIHFSIDHMENANIRIEDKDGKYLKVFSNGKWTYEELKKALPKLRKNKFEYLEENYGLCYDKLSKREQDKWDTYYYDYLGGDRPDLLKDAEENVKKLVIKETEKLKNVVVNI